MSQSDRIQYRKLAVQLKIAEFKPVFDSGNYTNFRSFNLVNNVKNKNINSNDLVESDSKLLDYYGVPLNNVFDASGNTTCPSYLCKPYNYWPNRVNLAGIYSSPAPQNYFYWENFNVCFGDVQGTIQKKSYNPVNGCDIRQVVRTKDTAPSNRNGSFYKNY
jgi:hypothetical protein